LIGSKTAEKNSAHTNKQTDRQTNRHYEDNGHLAVNQKYCTTHAHTMERLWLVDWTEFNSTFNMGYTVPLGH